MARGSSLDDLILLLGLGIVGGMAYLEWYKGQSIEQVASDIDKKLREFLDSIVTQLPSLPPPPTFTPPSFTIPPLAQPAQAYTPPPLAQPAQAYTPPPLLLSEPSEPIPADDEASIPSSSEPDPGTDSISGKSVPKQTPAPPSGTGQSGNAVVLGAAGDWDTNSKAKATADNMEKNNVQFVIGLGDYSYGPPAQQWFDQILGARFKGRFKGAQGNHDNNSYLSVFGMSKWNDVFKIGPNVSLVTIDTESSIDSATLTKLTQTAKSQSKWVIYAFHKPYVTDPGGHHPPSENKSGSTIDSVAKANGVKLILAGHNHVYEHYLRNGIHYVVAGTGGRKFYKTSGGGGGIVKFFNNTNGFLKISVGATLLCQFISNGGQTLESFTVS